MCFRVAEPSDWEFIPADKHSCVAALLCIIGTGFNGSLLIMPNPTSINQLLASLRMGIEPEPCQGRWIPLCSQLPHGLVFMDDTPGPVIREYKLYENLEKM